MICRAALAILLLTAQPVAAASASDAFVAGRFAEAAESGRREATDSGLITASRAASVEAAWMSRDRAAATRLLKQAEADIGTVLRRSPGNLDATLQLGIVLGYIAKLEKSPGGAKQARRLFETVLKTRPSDPMALGALGGWHGQSVATLGRFLAGAALGAKEGEALRNFEKAGMVKGADPVVPYFHASTLLMLSARNAPRARVLLTRAAAATPTDGLERLMQRNSRIILATMEAEGPEAARAVARKLGPFGHLASE